MEHKKFHCRCNGQYCNYCAGGLFSCTECQGAEGSLTTDCPERRLTPQQQDDVYQGKIDFQIGRGWVKPDGTGSSSSMGDVDIKRKKLVVKYKGGNNYGR